MKNYNFELNEGNVWLVGDTKQDTECVSSSGCKPILIGKGKFMENDYLKNNKNIIVLDSFDNLMNYLNEKK